MAFDVTAWDTHGMHESGIDNTRMTCGDYVELVVRQNCGSPLELGGGPHIEASLSATWVAAHRGSVTKVRQRLRRRAPERRGA